MASRPVGGETAPVLLEAALRALVVDAGPSVRKLVRNESEGSRVIMGAARTPPSWAPEDKASVILGVLGAVVDGLTNRRWKRTAQAALRLPAERYRGPEFDSLMARWRALAQEDAEREGLSVEELADRYRGYWRNSLAPHLARALHVRIMQLNEGDGWRRLRGEKAAHVAPAALALSVERQEVLYQFDGRRGVQSMSQRWLVAHGPVEYYEPTGWYYSDPDAAVEIVPLANCQLEGSYELLPQGGRTTRLRFSHRLREGERYYFAYTTRFNSDRDCRPTILNEIRSVRTDLLTVRAQFDPSLIPVRCWYFDIAVQSDGWRVPPDGASELLTIASNGYVEHEFHDCQHGRMYGLRWTWPS